MKSYWRLTYLLPAAIEEEWVAALWSAGTCGVQNLPPDGELLLAAPEEEGAEAAGEPAGPVRLEAWFLEPPQRLAGVLDEAAWHARGLRRESCEEVASQDWLAEWRRQAQPLAVGERFLLDPREPEEGPPEEASAGDSTGRIILRLPARNAFGTGSHESTRLAIELLEDSAVADARVLDVGTGTGVLAFAALVLGARRVVGFDIDVASAVQARLNAVLNAAVLNAAVLSAGALNAAVLNAGVRRFAPFAGTGAAMAPSARFDLLLVNVLPGRILDHLPPLVATLRPGGVLLFSGIVEEQGPTVKARCGELGLTATAERRQGEWVAYRFVAGEAAPP